MASPSSAPAAAVSGPRFVEVVVDSPIKRGAQTYTYEVPAGLSVMPGQQVVVPFGPRQLEGVALRLTDEGVPEVRPVLRTGGAALMPHQVELAAWIAEHYAAPIRDCVALFLPPAGGTPRVRRIARIARGTDAASALAQLAKAPRQQETFEALLLAPLGIDARALPSEEGLRELVRRGLAEVLNEVDEPAPLIAETTPILPLRLTKAQEEALGAIKSGSGVFLLHGVTGSGKTEVYLQAIAHTLEHGQQALLLVPEISLTPQTIARCASRFPGRVAVLHSALTARQRFGEWSRIRSGAVDLVIGPRSALFAPLRDLGLIVLDEEHDWTYKQEQSPRYHARETAIKLGRLTGAKVVLGSATPDLGSYYRAQKEVFTLLTLPDRISAPSDGWLPPVRIVDMRQELQAGNRSIFSRELQDTLRATLLKKEQSILFLNRRGANTFVMCRECGHTLECPDCQLPFTFHSVGNRLLCHNCGRATLPPPRCPECSSMRIRYFGLGTQRVAEEIEALLPQARVLRWDRDTARTSEDHERVVDAMREHRADVLVGTQMVAKGHDLPLVTLVGVISADAMLQLPDFRSAERTFQLLTQVAGRAGRGPAGGTVLIQSYNPQHPTLGLASRHDFHAFFRTELQFRKQMGYPPFSHVAKFVYTHASEEKCQREARALFEELQERVQGLAEPIDLTGPLPPYLEKSHGRFRWQIVARGRDLSPILRADLPTGWTVDVDPASLL
ncbi:MAG TPA: primosomal protein N' [Chloroflexota bacterium]|nr:primosomal protein N' [Chloroflexota bacterium]